MLYIYFVVFVLILGCSSNSQYIKYSNVKRCKNIERKLYDKYGEPYFLQISRNLSVFEWKVDGKIVIFKKYISGSCSLRKIQNGG